jgi:hypothetical protein
MRYVNRWSGGAVALLFGWASNHPLALPVYLAALAAIGTGTRTVDVGLSLRALQRRSVLEVLPELDFDPTSDEITRAARVLGSMGRPWNRRGTGLRIRLEGGGALELRYTLEATASSIPTIRTALGTYRGLELLPAERVLVDPSHFTAVGELRRAGRASDTLAEAGPGSDPLQVFTTVLEGLGELEAGAVVVDIVPATAREQRRTREHLERAAERAERKLESVSARVAATHRTRGLAARLDPEAPVFRVQVFTIGTAPDPVRAREIVRELEAGFGQWSGAAHWRRTWVPGPLTGWRRWRARSGLYAPVRPSLATSRELAAFLRPPTAANTSQRVKRAAGRLGSAPRGILIYDGSPDRLPAGAIDRPAGRAPIAVSMADSYFQYIAARSRSGKTELAITQFLHIALRTDHGALFVDPAGDAIDRILKFLAGTPAAERVTIIDLSGIDRPSPGFNILAAPAEDEGWAAEMTRANALRDAISAAMHWTDRHVRLLALLSRASMALAELGRQLPPELQPTVFQLESLLLDADWREAVLPLLSDEQRRYFSPDGGFDALPHEVVGGVVQLADRLRASVALRGFLGQSAGSYNARRAMDEGQLVLVCTGKGQDGELAGNLILSDLYAAAQTRAELAPSDRRHFWIFLDELQKIVSGGAGAWVVRMVEELAKFNLHLTAMNQNPARIVAGGVLSALRTNRSHLWLGSMEYEAAVHMTREYNGNPPAHRVANLPRRQFLASVTIDHAPSPLFLIHTMAAEELFPAHAEGVAEVRRAAAVRNHARIPSEVRHDLEALDTRILAALRVAIREADPIPDEEELPEAMTPAERARYLVYERQPRLSYRQAAAVLGVSQTTVRRWIGVLDSRGYPRTRSLEFDLEDTAGGQSS